MRKRLLLLFVAAPLFCAPIGFDDFCDYAFKNSPQVVGALADSKAFSYEKEYSLGMEPLSLEMGMRKIRTNESQNGYESSAMLGFSVKTPWTRSAEKQSFEAKEKTYLIYEAFQKTMLKIAVKRDYLLYLLSKEEEQALENRQKSALEALELAKKKFEAGRISKIELTGFETDFFDATRELSRIRLQTAEFQDSLKSIALSTDDVEINDLKFAFYPIDTALLESYASDSIYLKELALKKEELNKEIKIFQISQFDKIGFGAGYTKEQNQRSIDFRIVIPLNITGKNEKKIASLMSLRDGAIRKEHLLKERLKLSAKVASEKVRKIKENIVLLQGSEQQYESLYQMTKKGFDGGVISLFEFLASKNRYFEALSKTISYKKEYVIQITKIEESFARIIK